MIVKREKKDAVLSKYVRASDYIVMDVSDFPLSDGRAKMSWSIELLQTIRLANKANNIYQMHGQNKAIKTDILHAAIDAIMMGKPLPEKKAREYFEIRVEISRFYDKYIDLVRPSGLYIDHEIDLFVMGAGFDTEVDDLPHGLNFSFGTLMYDLESKRISIDDFMIKTRALIEEKKELAEVD